MSGQRIQGIAAEALILSDAEIAAIDGEIAHAPYRQAVAIDALKIVQEHRGWVSALQQRHLLDQGLRKTAGNAYRDPGHCAG